MSGHLRSIRSAARAVAANLHDTNPLTRGTAVALYIGVAGNIRFKDAGGVEVAATAVGVGIFPVQVSQVYSTNTTATGILALYDK